MKQRVEKLYDKLGKRFLSVLLAVVMVSSCLINIGQVSAANPNLETLSITNADMEDTTWTLAGTNVDNWTGFRADTSIVHGGSNSGRNTVDSDGSGDTAQSDAISVKGGAIYTIGAYVRTANKNSGDSIDLRVYQYDSANTETRTVLQTIYGNTSDWTKLQGSIQLEDSTKTIKIVFGNTGAGSKLYVDDVYGYRNSSSTTGGAANADFETLTTAEGGYQFPTGWSVKGYGSQTEGSLETPDFYATTEYYHSKVNSTDTTYGHSLYFAKESKETVTIENTNTFAFNAAVYSEFACGAYIRSANSDGFARVDLVVSDESGNSKTITGYTKMLNASKTLSDWKCFYSDIDIAKLNLGFTPTKAYYQIVFTGDKVECYIDDLFCIGTNDGYGSTVAWSDFHAVSGGSAVDGEEIVGWNVESGEATVANNTLTLTDGSISYTDTHLMENNTYEVSVTNKAEGTGNGESTGENLITNGDFDADGSMDTNGWSLGAGGTGFDTTEYFANGGFDNQSTTFTKVNPGNATATVVTDPKNGDNYCVEATAATSGDLIGCDIKGLTAGETYNISFKLYADVSSSNVIQAMIIDRTANGNKTYHLLGGQQNSTASVGVKASDLNSNSWTTYSCNITAGEGLNYWTLRFYLGGKNAWYIDDISVKHVSEYAENGGFDADTTGWSTNATMTWGATSGNGNGGVQVTNTATEQWIRTYVPVTGGQSYNFSYWFKCTDGNNTRIYTTIIQRAADKSTKTYDTDYTYYNTNKGSKADAHSYLIAGTLKPDATWRNVVGQFTAAEETVYAEVRIRLCNSTGTVHFDDFSFTGLASVEADGIVANEGDNAMKLTDDNSASYTVALEAGTYEYSYNVANNGLTTAGLKVGETTYTETSGTFTLDSAVSEVAFVTTGTGTAYFDDLVIKKVSTGNTGSEWTTSIKFFDINGDEIDSSKVIGYSGAAVLSQTISGAGTALLSFLAPDGVYKAVVTISGSGEFTDFVITEKISVNENSDWKSSFVWYPEDASDANNTYQFRFFRHRFDVDVQAHGAVKAAYLQLCADDSIWANQVFIDSNGRANARPTTTSADGKKDSLFYTLDKSYFTDGEHVLSFAIFQTTANAGVVFEGCIEYEDGYKDYLYSGYNGETLVSKLGCTSNVYNGASGDIRAKFISEITDDWHALSYNTNGATVTSEWVEVKTLGIPSAAVISDVAYNFAYTDRENVNVNDFGQNTAQNVNAGAQQTVQATLGSGEVASDNLIANGDFDADGSMDTTGWSLGAGGTGFDTKEYFTDGGFDAATSAFTASNVTQTIVTDPVDGDGTSLQLKATVAGGYVGYDIKNLTAGETYNVTLKLHVDTTASTETIQALAIDRKESGSNSYHLLGGQHNSTSGVSIAAKNISGKGWVTYSCNITANESLTYWTLRFILSGTTTTWYVDDISVKHVKEYAVNGGFDANTDGWDTTASMAWGESTGNGDGGVAVTNSATEQYLRTYVPVKGGQSYRFAFSFRCADNSNTRIYTTIIQRTENKGEKVSDTTDYVFNNNNAGSSANASSYLMGVTLKPDATWRNVVGQFTTAEGAAYAEVRIRICNATGTIHFDDFSCTGLASVEADGIVANEGDNAMKLTDDNSASYTVALEAGTYEYSYNVANSGLTTAGLKVGETTYTETSGTFTLDSAVSEVAFVTTGTGTAYFDDLVIKAVSTSDSGNTEVSGEAATLNGYLVWKGATVAHIDIEKSYNDDLTAVIFKYTVPSYLIDGTYQVYINQREFGVLDAAGANTNLIATLNVSAKTYSASDLTTAEVVRDAEQNNVELVLNGTKTSPVMYMAPESASYYDYSTMISFSESGTTLYSTDAVAGHDGESVVWTGLENGEPVIDYDALDFEIMRTLDLNENAKVMVNLNLDAPSWYTGTKDNINSTYADQLVKYSDGSYATGSRNGFPQVSFASTSYAELCEKAIVKLVEHMTKAGYADRIFAVKLSAGETNEWMNYGTEGNGQKLADYSEAALAAFRTYLGDANATIPTPTERNSATSGAFIDPVQHANVIAYNNFLGQISADRLTGYAKVVKDTLSKAGATWIVGGYNGYVWHESSSEAIGAAHTSSSDVLQSAYIDFISSPVTYAERISGYATGNMVAQDSVALNGKLYIVEQDNRVLRNGYTGNANSDTSRGYTSTVEESTKQITRDLAFDFVRNNGYWMFDMTGGWYDNTSLLGRMKALKTEYDKSITEEYDTGSNNEVAVFVSEKYYTYLTADTADSSVTDSSYTTQSLYYYQRQQLSQMGVSYDTYTIEDLTKHEIQDYKVYIVLSPIEITNEQLTAINAQFKDTGKTVVWVYMAGAYSGATGTSYSASNIEALTNFSGLTLTSAERKLQATVTTQMSSDSESKGSTFGYGSAATGPYITISDSSATTLATYANGDVACAYKNVTADASGNGAYTSIYSAVPNLSSEFLRDVCSYAGVNLYSADASDVVETNDSYIAVHSAYGGTKTLSLPSTDANGNMIEYQSVVDVLGNAGEVSAISSDGTFTYTLEDGDTALFRLATAKTEKIDWNDGMLENGDLEAWDTATGLPTGFTQLGSGTIAKAKDTEKGIVARMVGVSPMLSQFVAVEAGKEYVATFMFKRVSSDTALPLLQIYEKDVDDVDGNGNSSWQNFETIPARTITGEWQIYSVHYTAKYTGNTELRFRIAGGTADVSTYDIKNLYFDEYKGGILANGDMRLVNMQTGAITGWTANGDCASVYKDGSYWMNVASTESADGQYQANTVKTEANTTYIAKFTATASGEGNATFRIYKKNEAGSAYDNPNTIILTKDEVKDYKIAVSSKIASDTLYRFYIAKNTDAELSFMNAALIKNVGDYNEDGVTDATDLAAMRAMILGDQATDDFSDLTADDAVNSMDLVRIKKYAAQ